MAYCTATQLLEQFSADEIAQRADRGTPRLVDAVLMKLIAAAGNITGYTAEEQAAATAALALINSKLLDAESIVNGYLTNRYTIPLPNVPRLILVCTADIARYQLYDDMATEMITDRYKAAIKMLESVSKGVLNLGADVNNVAAVPKAGAKIVKNARVFNADKLSDYTC